MGVEGPTDDPDINEARAKRRRNLLATVLFSQGTPMLLSGDELGNSQQGNNNAYCQDNEIGWIDWKAADPEFLDFTRRLIKFRRDHPILRQKRFMHSRERIMDGIEDLFWWRPDGVPMQERDWNSPDLKTLCAEMRIASGTPLYAQREEALFLVFNRGDAVSIHLPQCPAGLRWRLWIDTGHPDIDGEVIDGSIVVAGEETTLALELEAYDE